MATITAKLRYLRVAPRKVRLVADRVRGLPVQEALDALLFARKSAAQDVLKLIKSAVASADKKGGIDIDRLKIAAIMVDQGPIIRRFLPRARGSASRINKKLSHITVTLEEK